jgi:uncharacterized protein
VTVVEAASLLIGAGIVAGIIGSGGGVTSLVSYPALLAVGIAPLPASIANLVAGVVMGPGSALSSRPELAETRIVLLRLLPVSILGTIAGAGLLLVTPPVVFARVVPFLVAAGSLVLVLQPTLLRLTGQRHGGRPLLILVSVGVVSVYGGYFGAGSGVMLLAVILLFVDSRVPPANAIKNILLGAISVVAATVFVVGGPVSWGAVLSLAVGLLIGSLLGPIIVRHLPPSLVRWIAATLGFVLAIYLWLRPA